MPGVTTIDRGAWIEAPGSASAVEHLESGEVLFFPRLGFAIQPSERALFSPSIASAAKNISFDPRTGRLRGSALEGASAAALGALVSRFADLASAFVGQLLPSYQDRIERGRASFRPVEIAGRATSWRKDDTRLHIDSFPASPVHGRRILRLFANVNLEGRPRIWRIGEDFEALARRFAGRLRPPWPGAANLLRLLHVTRSRRSAYDSLMLQLHDCMKADVAYQADAPQTRVEFPSGTSWLAFTDQVSHAAMAGQYQLEQTFLLPIEAMTEQARSPLRTLERMTGRVLT